MAFPACGTERSDIDAGLRTLPLLITKITGDVTMAVVYDPASAASHADAESIKRIVDSGIQVPGGGRVSALLVSVGELGKLSRARIAYLTPGLAEHFDAISTAAAAASILTISTDLGCVRAAKCIVGVATRPSVTIYYNKTAADAAKIEFQQAFSMVVKQL